VTFASESVKFAFHALPTAQQVALTEAEEHLAKAALHIYICNVQDLDVLISVRTRYQVSPLATDKLAEP
jgi:hypothetical protein